MIYKNKFIVHKHKQTYDGFFKICSINELSQLNFIIYITLIVTTALLLF